MRNKNPELKKISQLIKDSFFCYFKDDNVLVVSEDKAVLPFAFLIKDSNYPDFLLLSLAVDFPFCEKAVSLALQCNNIRKVTLTEQFYISQDGVTYLGDDALKYHQLETVPLEKIETISNTLH